MFDVINRSGYNLVILQEAQEAWRRNLPPGEWVSCLAHDQLFAARTPVPLLTLIVLVAAFAAGCVPLPLPSIPCAHCGRPCG